MTPPFTISFTLRVNESVEEHKGCAVHDEEFGRGQNTGMGWNDPTFAHDFVAKMTPWVVPAHNKERGSVLPARMHRCNEPRYREEVTISNHERRRSRWQY
jgi:hypothetical protein